MEYKDLVNRGRNFEEHKYLYKDHGCYLLKKDKKISESEKIKELVSNDEYFAAYVKQIIDDGTGLYEEDLAAKKNKSNTGKEIDGIKQYRGEEETRKKADEMGPGERKCEARIFEKYEKKEHNDLGYARYYQSPITREKGREGASEKIDIIFNKSNNIFICELKDIDSNETLLSPITEILTYYFCIMKKEENSNKYFIRSFTEEWGNYNANDTYNIIPTIIIPEKMMCSNYYLKKFLSQLKKYNINLECYYLEYSDPKVEINKLLLAK
ncbi:MAG: hypothetical protein IJ565_05825 [Bacilli bacterium]|nr:hypothetical protein [Bacilli bacterium]